MVKDEGDQSVRQGTGNRAEQRIQRVSSEGDLLDSRKWSNVSGMIHREMFATLDSLSLSLPGSMDQGIHLEREILDLDENETESERYPFDHLILSSLEDPSSSSS